MTHPSDPGVGLKLERPSSAPKLYSQDGKGYGAEVFAHYFIGDSDWLVTEYDPEEDLAFGWACLGGDRQNAELGYVSLAELESIRVPLRFVNAETGRDLDLGLVTQAVELEKGWPARGTTLDQAISELDGRQGR